MDIGACAVSCELGAFEDSWTNDWTLQMQINSEMEIVMESALRHHPRLPT